MSWNYADLSKLAKESGGPEALVDTLVQSGVEQGKESMYPWVLVAGVVGVLLWETGKRGWRKLTTLGKKSITEYEVQQAREELIRGITEYDLNNSSNGNDVPDGIAPEEGLDEEDENG